MSYKTILVHITSDPCCLERLDLAASLTESFDASLVAVHALFPFTPPAYILAQLGPEMIVSQKNAALDIMAKTEESLRQHLAARVFSHHVEWHKELNDPYAVLYEHAKYSDLVVIGQSDKDADSGSPLDLPERLVLSGGRPILILPKAGSFDVLGENVLVAWNASREATRAITDALPLLKRASKVHLLSIDHGADDHISGSCRLIADYLARHDVTLELQMSPVGEIDIGNNILSRAADFRSDLIVMGGYGHSRLREWALGGATRTILETMTVPVLMSH